MPSKALARCTSKATKPVCFSFLQVPAAQILIGRAGVERKESTNAIHEQPCYREIKGHVGREIVNHHSAKYGRQTSSTDRSSLRCRSPLLTRQVQGWARTMTQSTANTHKPRFISPKPSSISVRRICVSFIADPFGQTCGEGRQMQVPSKGGLRA